MKIIELIVKKKGHESPGDKSLAVTRQMVPHIKQITIITERLQRAATTSAQLLSPDESNEEN